MRVNAWIQIVALVAGLPAVQAETVTVTPVADTTLHEVYPANNLGGHSHVAAGATGHAKAGGGFSVTRGLFRFDLSRGIPAGSTIVSVRLELKVTFAAPGGPGSRFALHRLLQPWGEGTKRGNSGASASAGEATWQARMVPDAPWTAAGGSVGTDFVEEPSGTIDVTGAAVYEFASTPVLVADVQGWVNEPETNHGWLLRSQSEDVSQTARRFGSREDESNSPRLIVEYTPPAATELRITLVELVDSELRIRWEGGSAPYRVETSPGLESPAWEATGAVVETNEVSIAAPSGTAFFRVVTLE